MTFCVEFVRSLVLFLQLFDEEQVHPGQGQPAGRDHRLDRAVRRLVARLAPPRHRPAHQHLPAHAGSSRLNESKITKPCSELPDLFNEEI